MEAAAAGGIVPGELGTAAVRGAGSSSAEAAHQRVGVRAAGLALLQHRHTWSVPPAEQAKPCVPATPSKGGGGRAWPAYRGTTRIAVDLSLFGVREFEAPSESASREETRVPEGEPCPYCAHLAPNPEELRLHLLHLHPEVEPEPDWWDRDAVPPPPLLL